MTKPLGDPSFPLTPLSTYSLSLVCLKMIWLTLWLTHRYSDSHVFVILAIFWFSWQWPTSLTSSSSIPYNYNHVIMSNLQTMTLCTYLYLGYSQSLLSRNLSSDYAPHCNFISLKLPITLWFPPVRAIAFFIASWSISGSRNYNNVSFKQLLLTSIHFDHLITPIFTQRSLTFDSRISLTLCCHHSLYANTIMSCTDSTTIAIHRLLPYL